MLSQIGQWPGLTMRDLVELTGTSKQALSRVAKDLEARGFISTQKGVSDQRRRELRPTTQGVALIERVDAILAKGMAEAYSGAGRDAVTGFWRVLEGLVPVATRLQLAALEKQR